MKSSKLLDNNELNLVNLVTISLHEGNDYSLLKIKCIPLSSVVERVTSTEIPYRVCNDEVSRSSRLEGITHFLFKKF